LLIHNSMQGKITKQYLLSNSIKKEEIFYNYFLTLSLRLIKRQFFPGALALCCKIKLRNHSNEKFRVCPPKAIGKLDNLSQTFGTVMNFRCINLTNGKWSLYIYYDIKSDCFFIFFEKFEHYF